MFEKRATYNLINPEALNVPVLNSFTKDQGLIPNLKIIDKIASTASVDKEAIEEKSGDGDDSPAFDLQAEIDGHPDSLFIKCFAIKADETNDNGDYFSRDELVKATPTFVGVPLFTNHANADINEARGKVVHSWWDDEQNGIMIVGRVDAEAYPQLARGIKEEYVVGCFPPDAPVLMSDGTEKNICDIDLGDEVISGEGNVKKVIGTRNKGYKYPLTRLKAEGINNPILLTDYHNVVVYRKPEMCACGCDEVLVAQKDTRLTTKNFNRIFKQGHNPRGKKFDHQYIQKILAKDLKVGDFLVEPKIQTKKLTDIIQTEKEAFLVGLFLAEGSYEKRDGIRHSVIFNFAHTELETLADKCHDLLLEVFESHRNKPTINYYPESSQTRVCFYGTDIASWFYERCGEYSGQKQLNADVLNCPENIIASLLAGHIEGDGWNVKGKTYGLTTASPKLASQLRVLLASINIRTRFRIRKCSGWGYQPVHEITFGISTAKQIHDVLLWKKANVSKHPAASWHSQEKFHLRKITSIDSERYSGLVYDLEIEDDHTYCVNHIAVSNTSMGCQVQYSLCSVCHNYAETPDQYCSCIRERKTRLIQAKNQTCDYHEMGKETECPICSSKKGEKKKYAVNTKVFEYNYGIKFIENSFVVNPACSNCGVTEVIDPQKFRTKVAEIEKILPKLLKAAGEQPLTCTDQSCVKIGGQQELDSLNQALDMLSSVSQSMLNQKEQIDLEFLSDLVKVLADLQTVTDELNEQGYGRLQSPGQPPEQGEPGQEVQQGAPEVTNAAEPLKPTPGGGSKVHSGPAGQVGNVTSPLAKKKKINLEKLAQNIILKTKTLDLPSIKLVQKEKIIPDNSDLPTENTTENKTLKVAFSLSKGISLH